MMAMLWAQRIMSAPTLEEAHALWYRVPRLLKEKVREILIESGCEDLIPDDFSDAAPETERRAAKRSGSPHGCGYAGYQH